MAITTWSPTAGIITNAVLPAIPGTGKVETKSMPATTRRINKNRTRSPRGKTAKLLYDSYHLIVSAEAESGMPAEHKSTCQEARSNIKAVYQHVLGQETAATDDADELRDVLNPPEPGKTVSQGTIHDAPLARQQVGDPGSLPGVGNSGSATHVLDNKDLVLIRQAGDLLDPMITAPSVPKMARGLLHEARAYLSQVANPSTTGPNPGADGSANPGVGKSANADSLPGVPKMSLEDLSDEILERVRAKVQYTPHEPLKLHPPPSGFIWMREPLGDPLQKVVDARRKQTVIDERVRVHESGHALAAVLIGAGVKRVILDHGNARVEFPDGYDSLCPEVKAAIVLFGLVAETHHLRGYDPLDKYTHTVDFSNPGHDIKLALSYLKNLGGIERAIKNLEPLFHMPAVKVAFSKIRAMIPDHGWVPGSDILATVKQAVKDSFLEHRMTFEEVLELVKQRAVAAVREAVDAR
jgi:hypothetical protein